MFRCDECDKEIDRQEYYTNDGLCDDCLELEYVDNALISVYRINNFMLDAKYVSSGDDVYDNIYYDKQDEDISSYINPLEQAM